MVFGQAAGLAQAGVNSVAQFCGNVGNLLRAVVRHRGQHTRLAALPEKAGNRLRRALRQIIKILKPGVELALVAAAGQLLRFHKLNSHRPTRGEKQQVGTHGQRPPQQHPAKMRRFARGPVAKGAAPQACGAHQHHAQAGHFLQNHGRARGSAKAFPRRAIDFARRVQQHVVASLQGCQHVLHARLHALAGIGPVLHYIGNQHGMQRPGRQPSKGALHLAFVCQRARRVVCHLRVNNDGVNERRVVGHKQYGPRARDGIKPLDCHAVAQAQQQAQAKAHEAEPLAAREQPRNAHGSPCNKNKANTAAAH